MWISSLISWANTFKNKEFRPKIEKFNQHQKFAQFTSWESLLKTSFHHTMKLENMIFFRHSFRGLSPLKIENFDEKWKFPSTPKKLHNFHPDKVYLGPPFIILRNSKILIFLKFRHSFRGLTPLKIKNFEQKNENFHKHFYICTIYIVRKLI